MSALRALRVVVSPARTIDGIRKELPADAAAGADVVEVRVDRLAPSERGHLDRLFPAPLALLGTLRSRADGGEGPDAPEERRERLAAMSAEPFAYVDLEVQRDRVADLPRPSPEHANRWVRSVHLANGEAWPAAVATLASDLPSTAWTKIVFPASTNELLTRVIPALPTPGTTRFVVHTTGASGAILRAWADRLGMAAVYCAPADGGRNGLSRVEPTQIPVDRLRPAVMDSAGPFYAVLGQPTSHSWSPWIHSRWMHDAHQKGLYIAVDIATEGEFSTAVPALVRGGFRGFSVTSPWKVAALRLSSSSRAEATRVGCANTLIAKGEELTAANTDQTAVVRRLGELRANGVWSDGRVLVVGTGGAARAALDAARELGAERWVAGRNPVETERVANEFGAQLWRSARDPQCSVVFHATTVGREPGVPLGIPLSGALARGTHLIDFVYAPADPVLGDTARAAGATYEDGERLLTYQAAGAYRLWWGEEPPNSEPPFGAGALR